MPIRKTGFTSFDETMMGDDDTSPSIAIIKTSLASFEATLLAEAAREEEEVTLTVDDDSAVMDRTAIAFEI